MTRLVKLSCFSNAGSIERKLPDPPFQPENIGLLAAAVTAGNFAGLDKQLLNYLSAGYLASRIVYNIVYIHGDATQLEMATTGFVLYISWALEPMVSDYFQYLYDRNRHNHEPFCDEWQRDAERHNPQSYSIVFHTSMTTMDLIQDTILQSNRSGFDRRPVTALADMIFGPTSSAQKLYTKRLCQRKLTESK